MNKLFKPAALFCALLAGGALTFLATRPAEAQGGAVLTTLVSGPFTWEAEPGSVLRTTIYNPPAPGSTETTRFRSVSGLKVEFERITPDGQWVPSRSQTFHVPIGGEMRPGSFSTIELVQTDRGITVSFDTHIVEEIEFVVEKVERARVMSVHGTHQFSVGVGDPVPSVGTTKAVKETVWKEFSPAEEQLKGNPRH